MGFSCEICSLCPTSDQREVRPGAVDSSESQCSIKLESQPPCQGAGRGRGAAQFTKPISPSPKTAVSAKLSGTKYLVAAKWVEAGTQTMPLPALLNLFSTVGPKGVHVSGPAPSPPAGWLPGQSLVTLSEVI